jgi:hypothetical protein
MFYLTESPYLTAAELSSRCAAAARLSLRGTGYTPEDRAECAAHIRALVLSKHGGTVPDVAERAERGPRAAGTPCRDRAERAGMIRYLDTALSRHPSYWDFLRTRAEVRIPRESVRFSWLTQRAADFRRTLDADRKRDADHAAERAGTDGFVPRIMEDGPADHLPITAERAHAAALDMLAPVGLTGNYGAYLTAYTAQRLTGAAMLGAAVPMDRIAAELGYEGPSASKTLGMALTRGRKSIPSAHAWSTARAVSTETGKPYGESPAVARHLDAFHLLDTGGVARKPTASRNATVNLETSERYSDGITRECRTRTDRTCKRDMRRKYAPADWTRDLPPATAMRLARAAALRKDRRKVTDHGTRDRIDTERGAARPSLPSAG